LDNQITVADLRAIVHQFVSERDWQPFHDPKNLSASIAIEAAELMEIFQWLTSKQSLTTERESDIRQHTREELADIVIYCLALANALDIDLSRAIKEKMVANAAKYPIETSRGQLS
jgi:dCTP diphosphatase